MDKHLDRVIDRNSANYPLTFLAQSSLSREHFVSLMRINFLMHGSVSRDAAAFMSFDRDQTRSHACM